MAKVVRLGLAVVAALAAFTLALAGEAAAQKRVALVIGNNHYPNLPASEQLKKAVNDARSLGETLQRIGFEVLRSENLGRQGLVDRLDEFTRKLSPGDTAFFFFAGHGVAIGGGNFILPSDVPNVEVGQETRLARAAIGENDIVADLQARGVRVAVVVLDACRNNPFKRPGTRGVGGERGFTRSDPVRGVFSLYSAGIGQTALDRLGDADPHPNSVFTRVLVPALQKPGLHLGDLAFEVREEVSRLASSIGHDQRPAAYDETIGGRVYLAGPPGQAAASPPVAPPPAPVVRSDPCAAAEMHWRSAESIGSRAAMEDHLSRFPDCVFAGLARSRIEALARQAAVAPPVQPPTTAPAPKPAVGVFPGARGGSALGASEERALKPKDTFKECDVCPEMVVIPAGAFVMGSPATEFTRDEDEAPQHTVRIAKPFAVGKFEITVEQFAAFVKNSGHKAPEQCWTSEENKFDRRARSFRNPGFPQADNHPATCVGWEDAKAYVAWLSSTTGKPYRLLSEAEWEYAARGGTKTVYPYGDDRDKICNFANGGDVRAKRAVPRVVNSDCDDGHTFTAPVGSFQPNAFGLHDTMGNVFEWVEDCWHKTYDGAPADGSAQTKTLPNGVCLRVMRGGSWEDYYGMLRTADRSTGTSQNWTFGFRVARTLR